MNRTMLGFIAVVGSAIGAWWWTAQRRPRALQETTAPRDHGEVIFHNTPQPSDVDAII